MEGGVWELARQATAAARAERAAQQRRQRARVRRELAAAGLLPARKYRGVYRRGRSYVGQIWNAATNRPLWLGSFAAPEAAARAYDAAVRRMRCRRAKPNFPAPEPEPAAPPGEGEMAAAQALADLAQLTLARERAAAHCSELVLQQPAPPSAVHWGVPAAPAAAAQQQRVSAPLPVSPNQRAVPAPPFSQYFYPPAGASAFVPVPLMTGAYVVVPPGLVNGGTNPVTSSLRSSDPVVGEPDLSVGDNFTDDDGTGTFFCACYKKARARAEAEAAARALAVQQTKGE